MKVRKLLPIYIINNGVKLDYHNDDWVMPYKLEIIG
jgi:hypothetical protein